MTQPQENAIDTVDQVEYTEKDNALYEGFDPEEYKPAASNANKSVVAEFIKQLRPGMELYRVSIPVFILQPISLLEKVSIYSSPTDALQVLCSEDNLSAQERMLLVTNWALSTWRSIPRQGIHECKPYNPILGEQFHCTFDHAEEDGSKSVFVAEQVKHHPPVTAFHLVNEQRGFSYSGSIYPKTQFGMNSFTTPIEGNIYITLKKYDEVYVMKYPPVKASGILLGSRLIHVTGSQEIVCAKTNLKTVLNFSTSGTNNLVNGEISSHLPGGDKKTVYRINGTIHDVVKYTTVEQGVPVVKSPDSSTSASPSSSADTPTKKTSTKKRFFGGKAVDTSSWEVLYDCATIRKPTKHVPPLEEQEINHSRRVWHGLTRCLRGDEKDYHLAQTEKHIVEEGQRKKEIDERTWKQALFRMEPNGDWKYIGDSNSNALLQAQDPSQ